MSDFWTEDLTEEETEELLEKAASEIRRRKLVAPALLALELHKPLANITTQSAMAFSPFIIPFLGFDNVNNYSRLLSRPENVERLLYKLEQDKPPSPGATHC